MCSEVEKIENSFKDASELEDTDKEGHGDCFFLPGPPERALEIAKKFSSYEKVTEQRGFVTYKGENRRAECLRDFYGYRMPFCGDCGGRVA